MTVALKHLESTKAAGLPSDDAHILKVLFAFVNENCSCRIKGLGYTAKPSLCKSNPVCCLYWKMSHFNQENRKMAFMLYFVRFHRFSSISL